MPSTHGKDVLFSVEIPVNYWPGPPEPPPPTDRDCRCSKNPYCADELSKEAQAKRAEVLKAEMPKFDAVLAVLRHMKDDGLLCCSELELLERYERFHSGLKAKPG